MANPEHLKLIKLGVEPWNRWRSENPHIQPDLSDAALTHKHLNYINLVRSNLSHTNLCDINLRRSNLSEANLNYTALIRANVNFANFYGANLCYANLGDANLSNSNLSYAKLTNANLRGANLTHTNLYHTDLTKAELYDTIFAKVDLSGVSGLNDMIHYASSTIDVDTLYISHGQIPEKFLRDCGVPDEIIDIARTIRNGPPIQWHSCFISHSTKDEEFARCLHSRMRAANMRVWFAPEDLKGGKKLHEQLFEAIQIHDRLLIVLSEHSIQSEWVMTEIRKARETEKKEKRRKLFPIRLTDFETLRDWTCFDADTGKDLAVEVREYFIPDFSNWKDHDAFESAFARLKKDLEAENSKK